MQSDRWKRIQELYEAATALSPEKRVQFLAEACPADAGLRDEVKSLLAQQAESFLESGPVAAINTLTPGAKLGNFEIVELIGRGGMGEVYRARDSRLGRDVALKILPAEVAGDAMRRQRFETEARAVAAVSHPNIVAVFDVGTENGVSYIASELVDGEPLRGARFELHKTLDIAVQIAAGLAAAHDAGIVHRDLKPDNILLTRDSRVKILDFGLAQVRAAQTGAATAVETLTERTEPGMVMGTVGYMSPEQVRGLPVTHRTDLFSFGVVLYEMITGQRPFTGNSAMAACDAILHAQPRDFGDSMAPRKLRAIVGKLLEKDPADRYESASGVHRELKAVAASLAPAAPVRLSRNAWIAVAAAVVLAGTLGGWLWHRSSRQRWALETAAPEIVRLEEVEQYVKAAVLTREARAELPKDPTLRKLWTRATGEINLTSTPAGAEVSLRPYRGDPNAWRILGKTPLLKVRIPHAAYVLRLTKAEYAPQLITFQVANSEAHVPFKLRPVDAVPAEMVTVQEGRAILGQPYETAPAVKVDGFLIDRHEVTNVEYKKFVDARGYGKRDYWKQAFVRDGLTVDWEQAMALFVDATGRPGPATWEAGDYPKGHDKYPVAGVSWFEAAAYAEFVGKSLPTVYHWTQASLSTWDTPIITPGSNFHGRGTQPVGGEGTLSGHGTTDMAGNVKEWCLNEGKNRNRFILGGGFGEPEYMFNFTDEQSPWERRPNFGFRCVRLDSPPAPATIARVEASSRDYWKERPVSDEVFNAYKTLYAYDKTELNARVEQTVELDISAVQRVTFDAAYGNERVTAYLFLPKESAQPLQIVVYQPASDAYFVDKVDPSAFEEFYDFVLKNGRAILFPIYKGTYERRDGYGPASLAAARRDHYAYWVKDLGRSLDYMETRKDFDSTKVAYLGFSSGGPIGVFLAPLEKRIKAAILWSGGLQLTLPYLPDNDPFNFAPHVTIPVLMINGRYDSYFPVKSSQEPMFQLLGTAAKDKKHVIYEGGHGFFPRPAAVRESLDWLDKYLGPVRR